MEEKILTVLSNNFNLNYNNLKLKYSQISNEINQNEIEVTKIFYNNEFYYIDTDNNVYKHIIKNKKDIIGKYIGKYNNNTIIIEY